MRVVSVKYWVTARKDCAHLSLVSWINKAMSFRDVMQLGSKYLKPMCLVLYTHACQLYRVKLIMARSLYRFFCFCGLCICAPECRPINDLYMHREEVRYFTYNYSHMPGECAWFLVQIMSGNVPIQFAISNRASWLGQLETHTSRTSRDSVLSEEAPSWQAVHVVGKK